MNGISILFPDGYIEKIWDPWVADLFIDSYDRLHIIEVGYDGSNDTVYYNYSIPSEYNTSTILIQADNYFHKAQHARLIVPSYNVAYFLFPVPHYNETEFRSEFQFIKVTKQGQINRTLISSDDTTFVNEFFTAFQMFDETLYCFVTDFNFNFDKKKYLLTSEDGETWDIREMERGIPFFFQNIDGKVYGVSMSMKYKRWAKNIENDIKLILIN